MEVKSILPQNINILEKLKHRYQLHRKIGSGSFSVVYQALNIHTQRMVAIKIFMHHHQAQQATQDTFLNEINIMNKLKKIQGIPVIHNAGKSEKGFFIEMDLLSSSLSEDLHRKWTRSDIRKLGSEILSILKDIHREGVIHRDIKPDNILRDKNGKIFLADFGLATYSHYDNEINYKIPTHRIGIRKRRNFIGTPYYASLAAHLGYPQTPKSDIESLLYLLCRLHKKSLPWDNLGSQQEKIAAIENYKICKGKQWLKKCDLCFLQISQYLSTHPNKSALDYERIDQILKQDEKKENKIKVSSISSNAKEYKREQVNTEDEEASIWSLEQMQCLEMEPSVKRMKQYQLILFKNPFMSK